jgi:hypothetical protein
MPNKWAWQQRMAFNIGLIPSLKMSMNGKNL